MAVRLDKNCEAFCSDMAAIKNTEDLDISFLPRWCLTCIPIFATSDMMRWEMINVSWIYHLQKPPMEYFINTTEYFNKRAVGENHYEIFV